MHYYTMYPFTLVFHFSMSHTYIVPLTTLCVYIVIMQLAPVSYDPWEYSMVGVNVMTIGTVLYINYAIYYVCTLGCGGSMLTALGVGSATTCNVMNKWALLRTVGH